ncbi:LEAF RUST 10 DISEASE-RESISTANCE LOCUS RECEPTOR-LIKE PROTEIN KINASE-like 2.1 isoform X2 [Hevea brasiliensis]|nr:LEAF RUST 10 DISEASE-RESISTANCE LOCUS RECEPTOR-LIKE PROTEIN KINASE-like 2.1 isoform X2 [Hevea brasiliensis]
MLAANFSLNVSIRLDCYHCHLRGGECKTNNGTVKCIGGPQPLPPPERHKGFKLKLGLALSASGIALLVIVFCFCRKLSSKYSIFYWKKNTQCHQSIEAFLKNNGVMSPKRYKYTEVKKMTGSFNDKLGQGGYGSVFKGKLPDGRLVAVKILKESKSNGEEFINEVASISRTSHVNIVALLGFCFKGSKRALIYEFMFNGSLERYIYEENPLKADRQLDWETLHQIALGIARGLEYLHRGCNTRILHFDIKPHNILLDETFCPKISDFGLAKICPRKESIISLMDARGTAGYIAPEVFCRNFGVVSHKSDVYSYGMLVLEMVGGRKNICVAVDNTSEIYFPHWIFKRLELGEELELNGIDSEEDHLTSKKMALVSLWCIQTDPSNRPPISRVVEMLQERLESLPIPPKPYLSSPSRSSLRSTASSLISQQ